MHADLAQQQEHARLQALRDLELLDSAPDPEFDRLTRLAARCLDVPICMVSLVDSTRLWFKSRVGLDAVDYPRRSGFCQHVVAGRQALICADLSLDERFADHELVQAGQGPIQFYAGVPLWFGAHIVGTLCVMDHRARVDFDAEAEATLTAFAQVVCDTIRARQLKLASQREHALFADGPVAAVIWDADEQHPKLIYTSANLSRVIGEDAQEAVLQGATLESRLLKADVGELRVALRSHALSRLHRLDTVFRLACGQRWVLLQSYGDYDERDKLVRIRGYLSDVSRQKQLEASIEATKERLYLALESAQIGTWDLNVQTNERLHSERSAAMLGFRSDELDMDNREWLSRIHPFDRARVEQTAQARLALVEQEPNVRRDVYSVEYRIRHKAGHHIWVHSCGKLVSRDAQGRPLRVVGTLMDITQTKSAEMLRLRQQQMLDLVNHIQQAFLQNKSLTAACHALFTPLLQLTESQFGFIGITEIGDSGKLCLRVPSISNIAWDDVSHAWYESHMKSVQGLRFENLNNLFGHVVAHDTVVCTNEPAMHGASRGLPPGHPRLDAFLGIPLRHDGRVVGMVGLGNRAEGFDPSMVEMLAPLTVTLGTLIHARHVEEQRARVEEQLRVQATVDALTGLANRRRFFDVADSTMAQCRRYGSPATVALLDLDHFKHINDQHGHAAGDMVLRLFADLLREILRESDLPARIGGEEFAILMPSTDVEGALIPLERVRQEFAARSIEFEGRVIRATVSIGVSAWHPSFTAPDPWLASADAALYTAKAQGRDRTCRGVAPLASEAPAIAAPSAPGESEAPAEVTTPDVA